MIARMSTIKDLPADIASALAPVFAALPQDRAMSRLVVKEYGTGDAVRRVIETALAQPALKNHPRASALAAGLWLYADELDLSHKLSQQNESDQTQNYWHAIMHRREGDFSNSHHWFRRVGKHPAMDRIAGYDAHAFIDSTKDASKDDASLVDLQRREWATLFVWCAAAK